MDTYLPHAGYVQFPRGPQDFSPTVCPACFTPRTAAVCPTCHLDLAHPSVAQLDAASAEASAALDRRLELIGRIRFETAQPVAPVAAPAPPAPAPAAAAPTTVSAPVAAPPAPPRRHLGVQVILLIVGVSLLAVGAVFFLVYAFITFGLVWRSIIIGAVTIAAFVGATLLRRRRLAATAEAIAALAVVFVYLDAFAIRANDLFGAEDADGLVYWGAALVVSSAGFALWHRLSGLRLPDIVAAAAFAPGLALLVGGLTDGLDDGVRVFAALLALGAGTLVHPLLGAYRVERIVLLALGLLGLVTASFAALFVRLDIDWAPLVTYGLVVVVAGAHVAVLLRQGARPVLPVVFAAFGGVVAASGMFAVGARIGEPVTAVPVVAAAVVALVLESVARRTHAPAAVAAAWSAAGVAGVAVAVVGGTKLVASIGVAARGAQRWSLRGGEPLEVTTTEVVASAALLAVLVIAAVAWLVGGTLAARRLALGSGLLGILVLSVPLLPQLWLAVLAWLVLGAVAVVLLVVGRSWARGARIALLATGAVSLALAYSASWASIDTWWFGSVGTVALVVVARGATALIPVRAALLGLATVLGLVAIGSEAWHTNERFQEGARAGLEATHGVLLLAVVLLGLALLLARALSAAETRVLAWTSYGTALVKAAMSWLLADGAPGLVLPDYGASAVLAGLLVLALLAWALVPRTGFAPERLVASATLAPAVAWLLASLAHLVSLTADLAPVVAALAVAAVSLAVAGPRAARDIGVGIVVVPALVAAMLRADALTWLVLLLAAVAVLLTAVSRDGLFASASPRRHLGWAALGLGFLSLAWTLADRGVTDLEPYVLPLAGALLLVAAGAWRARRDSPVPPYLVLGALLVALVPLGAVSGTGSIVRPLVVAGASAALLLVGSVLRGSRYLDALAAAGAVGVLVVGLARPFALAIAGTADDVSLDAWVAGTALVVLLAAVAQSRSGGRARGIAAVAAVAATLVLCAVVELAVLRDTSLGTARALVALAVLAGLHIAGMLVRRAPFTPALAWLSYGLAVVVGVAGMVVGAVDPLEWGTGILAAALLVVGAVRLAREPQARSWVWLAPGLLVLLVPSLVATFVDQPVWRLVGLGVACVALVLVGAVRKLQAPLILGAVVVLVHAVRTFSPQIVAVYQLTEWWVWAVVGGAIIIFVAVTFERRMRDLRSLGGRISALR